MSKEISRSGFTEEVIKALEEKEEKEKIRNPKKPREKNIQESREIYNLLCHDDPIIDYLPSYETVSFLCYLMSDAHYEKKESKKFGICNRLVKGLLEILNHQKTNTQESNIQDESKIKARIAEICFTIYVKTPFLILKHYSKNPSPVTAMLGNYFIEIPHVGEEVVEEESKSVMSAEEFDDLKELIAEESDPDDFEYESCSIPTSHSTTTTTTTTTTSTNDLYFAPEKLETPKTNLSHEDVQQRVWNLLNILNYKHLGLDCISEQRWKSMEASSVLIGLAGFLTSSNTFSEALKKSTQYSLNDQAQLVYSLLINRSLDQRHNNDVLYDFLQFISNTLVYTKKNSQKQHNNTLALQSLSCLCNPTLFLNTDKTYHMTLLTFLSKHIDKFALFLETSLDKEYNKDKHEAHENEIITHIISIFHYMITTSNTNNKVNPRQYISISKLSNSGLFRQVILFYISLSQSNTPSNSKSNTTMTIHRKIIFASVLELLCHATNNELLLYVSRLPTLTNMIKSETFLANQTLEATLWSILLQSESLSASPSSKSKLRLVSKKKQTNHNQHNCETKDYKSTCKQGFQRISNDVLQVMQKNQVNYLQNKDATIQDNSDTAISTLEDFSKLITCVTTESILTNSFKATLKEDKYFYSDSKEKLNTIQAILNQIQNEVMDESSNSSTPVKDDNVKNNNENQDHDIKDDEKKSSTAYQMLQKKLTSIRGENLLESLRKATKELSTLLLLDYEVSSKAD